MSTIFKKNNFTILKVDGRLIKGPIFIYKHKYKPVEKMQVMCVCLPPPQINFSV